MKGKITGLKEGLVLELIPFSHDNEKPVDSIVVKNGEFVFTGNLEAPRYYQVRAKGEQAGFFVMMDNSKVTVTGKADYQKNEDFEGYSYADIKIEGSKLHEELLVKTRPREEMNALYDKLSKENEGIRQKIGAAMEDTNQIKTLQQTPEYKKMVKDEKDLFDGVKNVTTKLIADNKDTWWGPFLLMQQLQWLEPKDTVMYVQFSDVAKDSYYGKKAYKELYPKSLVGSPAPALEFVDEQNRKVTFESIAQGKKYVVLDFWASWCGPCRKAIPALKAFYEKNSKDVQIISVSIDAKKPDWVKANEEENLPWPSFLDHKKIFDAYGSKTIPAMYVLDASGKVVAENVTAANVESKIK